MHINKIILFVLCIISLQCSSQTYTNADTLRGTLNANRTWWNVTYYDLKVTPNLVLETINGTNSIHFNVLNAANTMQIDLQQPLQIQKILYKNELLTFKRNGNTYLITFKQKLAVGTNQSITIHYTGKPRKAVNAPWDGGIVWAKDAKGRPFINTACQGLGASVWWPCKDHQSDEPDSMQISVTVPETLVDVSNGRLRNIIADKKNKTKTFVWFVSNPINNYNACMNIAKYVNFTDTLHGEKGVLDLNYYVLDYNLEKAKTQFVQAKQTIRAFEYWFGPYPFYEDSYKLVETHHLGMEHQSAVAYGNKYGNGYLGSDLSGTGWGKKWDYIIVHESGHEWFGNNVTTNDIADMWVHEGITDYSETLFTEYYYGKRAGNEYVKGIRNNIQNDAPIIGTYGVNKEGSGDMYYKGANLMHTIRQIINDDEKFRQILRGISATYYHKTVTSSTIEEYITYESGKDLTKVFDQYLRSTTIPILNFYTKLENNELVLYLKFTDCIKGFTMPVPINNGIANTAETTITVADKEFVKLRLKQNFVNIKEVINPNIYILFKKIIE